MLSCFYVRLQSQRRWLHIPIRSVDLNAQKNRLVTLYDMAGQPRAEGAEVRTLFFLNWNLEDAHLRWKKLPRNFSGPPPTMPLSSPPHMCHLAVFKFYQFTLHSRSECYVIPLYVYILQVQIDRTEQSRAEQNRTEQNRT